MQKIHLTKIRNNTMKRFTFYLAALILGIFLLGTSSYAQEITQPKKPLKVHTQIYKQKVVYTCPMDPEVISDKPGRCPRCKMNLEKKAIKMNTQTKIQKDVYACPMHQEITSDKPTKCSKCGMMLEKKMTPKVETKSEIKSEMYTCPMHSEVKSDKPGNCSKCGMNLVIIKN
jgi:hypothetical protein